MSTPWLASLFPRLSAKAQALGVPRVLLDVDSAAPDAEHLLSHAAAVWASAEAIAQHRGFQELLDAAEGAIADIHDARQAASPLEQIHWDFLRLFVAVCPLTLSVGRGENGLAFDWIVRSLADVVKVDRQVDERELSTQLLEVVCQSPVRFIRSNAIGCVVDWSSAAYYYGRRNNTLTATLSAAVPAVAPTLLRNLHEEAADQAAFAVLGWLDHLAVPGADEFAAVLSSGLRDSRLSRRATGFILYGLACRPRPTAERSAADWAHDALTYGDALQAHEIVQLRTVEFTSAEDVDQDLLGELIKACRLAEAERRMSVDPGYLTSVRGLLFRMIEPGVRRLAIAGRVDDSVRLLAAWRGHDGPVVAGATLLLALNENEVSIAREGTTLTLLGSDGSSVLSELVQAMNRALGLQVIRDDIPGFEVEHADRLGVPSSADASAFEQAAEAWLAPKRFEKWQGPIVQLGSSRTPTQALLATNIEWAVPISLSLGEPLAYARPKRAVVWRTGMAYATEEAEAVCAGLQAGQIAVEIIDGHTKGVADFVQAYSDPGVDLIWFSGHTEFDAFRPSQTYLELGTAQLSLEDLAKLPRPARSSQRLIVLNTCDGAAAAVHSGLAEVGVSVTLAGAEQAVCSHQWPTPVLPAAAFGSLLAAFVGEGQRFIDAYVQAVRWMRRGTVEVAEKLRGVSDSLSLIDRLLSSGQKWTILDWGSAALFE
jgi:hypothetical protein